jgi:hypothetical protein
MLPIQQQRGRRTEPQCHAATAVAAAMMKRDKQGKQKASSHFFCASQEPGWRCNLSHPFQTQRVLTDWLV